MPTVDVVNECPVFDSFRVQQVGGMFDVPIAERVCTRRSVDIPDLNDFPWQIGLIVGPSASGKSTLAKQLFGESALQPPAWPTDRAVIDCFGELPTRQITSMLTAVGFSSPPSWIKPYSVLSGGERFRCDLARALAAHVNADDEGETRESPDTTSAPLVVFDEFTSVVDRTVAQVGSAALAKAIRGDAVRCRFVAVTCHYDVAEWLEPDWVLDMASRRFTRRRLRRPPIELSIFRCRQDAWRLFAPHHYLSGQLSPAARCYLATWRDEPVAFCATLTLIGRRGHWRISRLVTLPDFQGLGIGMRVAEAIGQMYLDEGLRLSVTASHPALLAHCRRSSFWRPSRVMRIGSRQTHLWRNYRGSRGRTVVSFNYIGQRGDVGSEPRSMEPADS